MAVLSYERLRKELTEQRKRKVINLALLHQNRLRFHIQTEPNTPALAAYSHDVDKRMRHGVASEGSAQALFDFLGFVENLIPHDKYKTFLTLFRFPVPTNEITAVCFDKLSRIFDGRDAAYSYQFTSRELRDDWEWYRQEMMGEPRVWAQEGWRMFQTEINSVLVVDMPEEQKSGDRYPQPYFYWLPIRDVVAYDADPVSGQMEWIAFRQDGDKLAVMDDATYRLFEYKSDVMGAEIMERAHDLGYCPARFFWNEPMSQSIPDVKRSPVTKALGRLDWWLFFHISKEHLDMYGSYPIYSGYAQDCDYHNDESGDTCNGGYLVDARGQYKLDMNGLPLRCPKCGDKRIAGVGSFVEIPVPVEGQPDLRNPVQMLTVDRSSLDYNVSEEERQRTDIITSIVGTNEEVTTRDALNEQQIKANFESMSTVLKRVKIGFETAQKWVDDTVCRLRYGSAFLSSSIDYGTEFYLMTTEDLRERYKSAKEAGASEAELDALHDKILETEFRNNPTMQQRMLILADVEPYRHMSREEVVTMAEKGAISRKDMLVKVNFADYIRRFERENMNIIEFAANIDYARKIEAIRERLEEYARENTDNMLNN